jgi:glucans biosynthesis protein C
MRHSSGGRDERPYLADPWREMVLADARRRMAKSQHVHWVDWLKVLAVFGVFIYHSAMVYAYVDWVINNRQRSLALTLFAGAGFSMGMPLLFLLSGSASFFALRKLGPLRFVDLRFRRLVIPLVAGLAVLSPLQAYLALLSRGVAAGDLWSYYPRFFAGIQAYFDPPWIAAYGYHLWFLGFLFLYSALALPFFAWVGTAGGRRFGDRMAALARRPGGLLLFALLPALAQIALRARYPWYTDWADFAYWLAWFAAGYLLVTDRRFETAIAARWRESLAIAAGSTATLGAFAAVGLAGAFESHPVYTPLWALYEVVRTVNTWSVVLLVLALGIHLFNRAGRLVGHLDEAVLPFFVIHHPVVVLVAFFAVQWDAGLWVKFAAQTALALALTMSIYELLVRPFNPMRWMFGLGALRESSRSGGGRDRDPVPDELEDLDQVRPHHHVGFARAGVEAAPGYRRMKRERPGERGGVVDLAVPETDRHPDSGRVEAPWPGHQAHLLDGAQHTTAEGLDDHRRELPVDLGVRDEPAVAGRLVVRHPGQEGVRARLQDHVRRTVDGDEQPRVQGAQPESEAVEPLDALAGTGPVELPQAARDADTGDALGQGVGAGEGKGSAA